MKRKVYRSISVLAYQFIDAAVIAGSILVAYKLYRISGLGVGVIYKKVDILLISVLIGLCSIVIMQLFGTYQNKSSVLNVEEIKNSTKGISISFLLIMVVIVLGKLAISRLVIIFSFFVSLVLIIILKTFFYSIKPFSMVLNKINKKVLIYGAGDLGRALYRGLNNSPNFGVIPVGFIDDNPEKLGLDVFPSGFNTAKGIRVLGNRYDIKGLIESLKIDEIIVAISNIDVASLNEIKSFINNEKIKWAFVPNLYGEQIHKLKIEQIGQIPLILEAEANSIYEKYVKRIFDILISTIITVLLLPIFIIISILIKLDSKGPAIFIQKRVGKNGNLFNIYKFRTMYVNSNPYSVNPLDHKDPRITKVGRFVRKSSLDELPQLFNVLGGNMSLVGPRPEMPFIVEQYNEIHRERLKVLPGITGLWQLSGDRKKAIHENMEYDLYYIRNISFFLDIATLAETLIFAFKGI